MKSENKSNIVESYNHLVENLTNVKDSVKRLSHENMSMKIEYAKTKFHDLEKIGKHDLDLVTQQIHIDITTASKQINKTKKEFKEWIKKDIELTEDRLMHLFENVVDQSRVELQQMEYKLHEWHSGEVSSSGTFACKNCGEKITLSKSQIIHNCPKCDGDLFHKDFDFN